MKDINIRFREILNKMFNGNVSEFARKSNIPQPTLNNIVGNRESKPSFDNLERLINSIELLNCEWLLTGKGDMIKRNYSVEQNTSIASEPIIELDKKEENSFAEFIGYLREKDSEISKLRDKIEEHVSEIARLNQILVDHDMDLPKKGVS